MQNEIVIEATKKWIKDVVIGCKFCPFASEVFLNNNIFYYVNSSKGSFDFKKDLRKVIGHINKHNIATALIIYTNNYNNFINYWKMYALANNELRNNNWNTDFQIASFHPQYIFEGVALEAASHYTNRSPFPMLHILREAQVSNAVKTFKHADLIPSHNIAFAQKNGVAYFEELLKNCFSK